MKNLYAFIIVSIYISVLSTAIFFMLSTSSQAYFSALTIFNSIMIIQFPILIQILRDYKKC